MINKKQKVTTQQVIDSYYRNFKKHAEVARDLGISRERVRQILTPLGLKSETNLKKIQDIKTEVESGKTLKEISEKIGIRPKQVGNWIKRENLPKALDPRTKYTKEKLIELYKKHNGHYSKIAAELSIPQPCVSRLFKVRGLKEQYPSRGRELNTER